MKSSFVYIVPLSFKRLYPDCYKGYVSYENCPKVFSNSKINLCLHATSFNNYGSYIYYSERLPQILGSHGLLYCETEYQHLLIPNVNYILADPHDPIGQIKEIIEHYHDPKYQEIRNKGYELALRQMTWETLRQKVSYIYNNLK